MIANDEIDDFLSRIRKTIEARGVSAILLIDDKGAPILVPVPGAEVIDKPADDEPIVRTRTYALTTTCRACKNNKQRCCYQVGGETICYTRRC